MLGCNALGWAYLGQGYAGQRLRAATFTSAGTGTSTFTAQRTFYVDPAGSDSNNGLSSAAAWQTVSKVNSSSFNPGDQILFKRGGTWRGTTLTPPSSGIAGAPVTFGAYGAGADPILSGGSIVTSWSVFSGSTYQAALGTAPTYVVAGSTPLTKGSGSGSLTANQWFWASNVLYVHLGGTNPSSLTVEAATLDIVCNVDTKTYVTLSGLAFRFGADRTIRGNAAGNLTVTGCSFKWCGYRANSGTLSLGTCPSTRVTTCTFDQLQNDGVWVWNSTSVEIDHCTMTAIGALAGDVQSDCIQFENTFGSSPNSNGLWIHDNQLALGGSSPKGCIIVNADVSVSGTATGIVEKNVCDGGNYGVAVAAAGLTVRFNVLKNQVSAFGGPIHVDSGFDEINDVVIFRNLMINSTRAGIILQSSALERRRWTIAHNTIVDCAWCPIALQAPVSGTFKNNIVWYTTTAPTFRMVDHTGVVSGDTMVWDYNIFRDPGSGTPFRGPAASYATFALWKAGTGYDAHSLTSDPLFVNPGASDYFLQSGSPAIDAGVVISGLSQPTSGSAPDIGLYERVVFTSAGSGTSSFTLARRRAATLTSAGSGGSTFVLAAKRQLAFSSTGSGASSFSANRQRPAALASAGSGTTSFAATRKRAATLASAGTGTSTFTVVRKRAVSFASAGSGTSAFVGLATRKVSIFFLESALYPADDLNPADNLYPRGDSGGVGGTSFTTTVRRGGGTFTSAGSGTSTFTRSARRRALFQSDGGSTTTFVATRRRPGTFASAGTSTSAFARTNLRSATFASPGSSTSSFALTRRRPAAFSSSGSSTSVFGRTALRKATLVSAGVGDSEFDAVGVLHGATLTSTGTGTSSFALAALRKATFTSSGSSSSSFARIALRKATLSSTGTGTSSFVANVFGPRSGTFNSVGSGTSTFSPKVRRAASFTSTGTGTSSFVRSAKRQLVLSSAGAGTSTFTLAGRRAAALTSTGSSTSTFAATARRRATFSSTGSGTSSFVLVARRRATLASAGTSTSIFSGSTAAHGGTFTSIGNSSSSFTPTAKRSATFSSTGSGTSSFVIARIRALVFSSSGSGASTWTRSAQRGAAFASSGVGSSLFALTAAQRLFLTSTGSGTSVFSLGARRVLVFSSNGIGTSVFHATARNVALGQVWPLTGVHRGGPTGGGVRAGVSRRRSRV